MKRLFFCLILLCCTGVLSAADTGSFTTLVDRLYEKYVPVYRKYSGILSRRRVLTKVYDPDNNSRVRTEQSVLLRKNYFYKAPDVTVLSWNVEGKQRNPEEYDSEETAPFLPIFGPEGRTHYRLVSDGEEIIDGILCHRIRVIPKKRGFRFFSGHIWISKKKERFVCQKGIAAEMHWAVKEFSVHYHFTTIADGIPVLDYGTVKARVHVFLVRPDRRFVYTIESLSNTPMKREK